MAKATKAKVKLPKNAQGVTRGKPIPTVTEVQNPNDDRAELIIKQAKDDFESASNHWNEFREKASDCLLYLESEYLRSDYIANRESTGLPVLTENRIPAFHETVVSQLSQNRPAIQIEAATEDTDPEFAEQLGDSVRTIEQDSVASIAYTDAAWYAIGTGIGYARVVNEYVDDDTFEQKLKIIPVEDPSTVYLDPSHKCLVGSDCNYALVVVDMPYNTYLRNYGKTGKMGTLINESQIHGFSVPTQKNSAGWITEKTVRIAEYYVKEWFTKTIYKVWDASIGAVRVTDKLEDGADERDSREVKYAVIKRYVLNDKEILEEETWPGKYIPIVACKGIEFWNKTRRHLKGMIDDMRDPQRRLDFIINWQAEMMQLAPKAPYIGTSTMFEDNQDDWANINLSSIAYVTYKVDPLAPNLKPERDIADVQLNSSQMFYVNAVEGIKAVTGMQAPLVGLTLGGDGNQEAESGTALEKRIQQGNDSTFHFQDHIRHFVAHIGQIIVDAMPTFYGESGRRVMATKRNGDKYQASFNDQDNRMLKSAKFNVRVETGPAFATKEQQDMETGLEIIKAFPESAPVISDLIAGKGQGHFWKLVEARLRAMVPPAALAATENVDTQEAPQMIANLKAQVSSLTQQNQKLTTEALPDKTKIQKLEIDNALEKGNKTWDLEKIKLEQKTEQDKVAFEKEKLRIEEQKIILEGKIKHKELELEEREILLKEKEFQLKVTIAKSDIASDMMEHGHKVEKLRLDSQPEPEALEEPETETTGADGDMEDLSTK